MVAVENCLPFAFDTHTQYGWLMFFIWFLWLSADSTATTFSGICAKTLRSVHRKWAIAMRNYRKRFFRLWFFRLSPTLFALQVSRTISPQMRCGLSTFTHNKLCENRHNLLVHSRRVCLHGSSPLGYTWHECQGKDRSSGALEETPIY